MAFGLLKRAARGAALAGGLLATEAAAKASTITTTVSGIITSASSYFQSFGINSGTNYSYTTTANLVQQQDTIPGNSEIGVYQQNACFSAGTLNLCSAPDGTLTFVQNGILSDAFASSFTSPAGASNYDVGVTIMDDQHAMFSSDSLVHASQSLPLNLSAAEVRELGVFLRSEQVTGTITSVDTTETSDVPEPGGFALLSLGGALFLAFKRAQQVRLVPMSAKPPSPAHPAGKLDLAA